MTKEYQLGTDRPRKVENTWYRGEHCNFIPSLKNLKEKDAISKYILHGWVPDKPCITHSDVITTFGSCFAVHIKNYLSKRGYKIGGYEPERVRNSYVIHFGSGIVNTFAIRQQFEWAYENKKFQESLWHNSETEIMEYSESIRKDTKDVFENTDVFILTLGLSEVWYSKETGDVFWRAIPERAFDESKHGFRVSTVEENTANLKKVIDLIKQHRPAAKIIFSISPVPLLATFRDVSCITADSVSKSILRVAVDNIMRMEYKDVFYWPSYEIVKNYLDSAYEEDNRHIKPEAVNTIMNLFSKYYLVPSAKARKPEMLFVIGAYKSGTTSLMGMLNCHRDIYLEGELFGHKKSMNRFKRDHPKAVASCNMTSRTKFYKDYIRYLRNSKRIDNYRYVGEKIATLSFNDFLEIKNHKSVFICRDIRTWLAKPALPNIPACKKKKWATQFAVEYTAMLIRSFGLSKCYRIKMEDMLADNSRILKEIGNFIDMPLISDLDKWWERMGKYDDPNDPKGKMEWWDKQPSSLLGPSKDKRDVKVEINPKHVMWKTILPIFDKYYNNMDKKFSPAERKKDLRVLAKVALVTNKREDLYKDIDIKNIAKGKKR